MSASAQPQNSRQPGKKGSLFFRLFAGLGILLGVGVVGSLATLIFGNVSGEEFSPDTFARRHYSYLELPLVHIQITPIHRVDKSNQLEIYLRQQKLVNKKPADTPRWDMVYHKVAEVVTETGDAQMLCNYLDVSGSRSPHFWLTWTKTHPLLAAEFWPVVAELARRELYLFTPDLFQLASSADDSGVFRQQTHDLMAEKLLHFASVQERLNRPAAVRHLAEWAVQFDQADPETLKQLQEMLARVPETASQTETPSQVE